MCTVSISPLKGEKAFVLTSNRDEAPGRDTLPPKVYQIDGLKMLFPKDVLAGGTWLGLTEEKRLICLLNGAFEKHERKLPYKKSRGVVVTDLLAANDFFEAAEVANLAEVEPFTIVAADWKTELIFSEFVWDGNLKHLKKLSLKPQIWSSSPLYSSDMKQYREKWFEQLLREEELSPKNLLNFHFSAGKGDKDKGVIMDRGFVKTRSISQVVISAENNTFYYKDLATSKESFLNVNF